MCEQSFHFTENQTDHSLPDRFIPIFLDKQQDSAYNVMYIM